MNILFIFHSPILPQNGGVERVTSLLGTELAARGHYIYYLSTGPQHKKGEFSCSKWQYMLDCGNNEFVKNYQDFIVQHKIDVVISQQANEISLKLLANSPARIKKISVYHIQPFPDLYKERDIKRHSTPRSIKKRIYRMITIVCPYFYRRRCLIQGRRLFKNMAATSDKIVLLSSRFIPRIISNVDIPEKKLAAINNPNSFTIPDYDEIISKENLIIYVGRLENIQKNINGFIKMWHEFSATHPDWKAEIIGEGPARDEIERYITKYGVKNISLVGRQTDVQKYYSRAKFVCLTSHSEGWGMVLTEGMAYGCVPVCFDSYESCRDIIDDGDDGIIASAFNTSEMADRISEIADNPSMYKNMAKRSSQKVRRFDISAIVDQWESLINNI